MYLLSIRADCIKNHHKLKTQPALNTAHNLSLMPISHLQVDLAADVHQRTMRAAQKYSSGKELLPTIFDEAQYEVFKELLPYWAGFNKSYKQPDDVTKKVCKFFLLDDRLIIYILMYVALNVDKYSLLKI